MFFSGVLPVDDFGKPMAGTIIEETHAVLKQVQRNLLAVGAEMTDVIRATVWLSDLTHFEEFNTVYAEYFAQALPARSTVQARLNRGALIEIEVHLGKILVTVLWISRHRSQDN